MQRTALHCTVCVEWQGEVEFWCWRCGASAHLMITLSSVVVSGSGSHMWRGHTTILVCRLITTHNICGLIPTNIHIISFLSLVLRHVALFCLSSHSRASHACHNTRPVDGPNPIARALTFFIARISFVCDFRNCKK